MPLMIHQKFTKQAAAGSSYTTHSSSISTNGFADHNKNSMSSPENNILQVSDAAAAKVFELMDTDYDTLYLRVFIQGGGCSGFQYGFKFDDAQGPNDTLIKKSFVKKDLQETVTVGFLVDHISIQYIKGACLDYRESVAGNVFVVNNPNAKTTCGCGSSFARKEE